MTEVADLILCRATIHLPGGLHPGWIYWVDGADPYVLNCLDKGYLVHEVELQETAEASEAVLTTTDAPVAVDAEETVLADPDATPADPDHTEAYTASPVCAEDGCEAYPVITSRFCVDHLWHDSTRVNNDHDDDGA